MTRTAGQRSMTVVAIVLLALRPLPRSLVVRARRRYYDWDVYVHSNQPDQSVTVSGGGKTRTWHTDSWGYADVYFNAGRSAAGEQVDIQVGAASCSTTL